MVRVNFLATPFSLLLLVCLMATGCTSNRADRTDHSVWFVHATDPHIYLDPKDDSESAKHLVEKQQSLDERALSDLLQQIRNLPQSTSPSTFLLITGDFGVDPCLVLTSEASKKDRDKRTVKDCLGDGVDKAKRDAQVEKIAQLFGTSPIRDIYFVAGNNDLPLESADNAALAYFNQFFDDVQKKITEKKINVLLHNLTRCYATNAGPVSTCFADIADTRYRLIGFPSHSFKNRENGSQGNLDLQTAQFNIFQGILDQSSRSGKKILLVTHIPELDDPYYLAQDRYAGRSPDPPLDTTKVNGVARAPWSTWNVKNKLLDDWKSVLASQSVVAVLAGHLHDPHREIYRQPYLWSTPNEHRVALNKLFLAPPLSVKNQDASPIQARGFSLVRLDDDDNDIDSRFYWYDAETNQFNSEPSRESSTAAKHKKASRFRWSPLVHFQWLWNMDPQDSPLQRMAVMFIALLTAFLTVVAIWQIPLSDDPLAKKVKEDNPENKSTATDASPFTSRFGKTIVAGLGGLVVTEVAKTLGNQTPTADTKWYYIVCFIFFFFLLLLSLNFVRAVAEALRARVAIVHYPLARPSRQTDSLGGKFLDWIFYWFMRTLHWFFSLRVPTLTFFDTFINLIQGKNQTTTRAFADAIIDQQRNVVRVADTIRTNLNALLETKISKLAGAPSDSRPRVRVNISVLSSDQSTVFYISRTPDSALIPFTKNSVAWVSVFTGQIRWYEASYKSKPDIVLFDNQSGTIAGAKSELKLSEYYQERQEDYEAFIILPVPWPQRGFGTKYVKGAIQISFRKDADFRGIWAASDVDVANQVPHAYPRQERMLEDWCIDAEVRTSLNDAVAILGELLRGFNEVIYRNYIEPNQAD